MLPPYQFDSIISDGFVGIGLCTFRCMFKNIALPDRYEVWNTKVRTSVTAPVALLLCARNFCAKVVKTWIDRWLVWGNFLVYVPLHLTTWKRRRRIRSRIGFTVNLPAPV